MTEPPPEHADQRSIVVCVDETTPWPFVTRRVFVAEDGETRTLSSRHHRKGLLATASAERKQVRSIRWRCLWMPRQLNWWIGTIFSLGSLLFAAASLLSLAPTLAGAVSFDSAAINAMFFAGSIPFTTAAYLQLFQAANAKGFLADETKLPQRTTLLGWRPHDIGWLSCALQFVGTILFNFNTFDAMIPSLNWFQSDLLIWAPNIIGSILFLASGYLAFIETCHAHWAWQPKSVSWWVVFTNLLGCVGFMISAVFAIYLPVAKAEAITISITFTLIGAIGFLVGSLLMLPETAAAKPHQVTDVAQPT